MLVIKDPRVSSDDNDKFTDLMQVRVRVDAQLSRARGAAAVGGVPAVARGRKRGDRLQQLGSRG